jgi:hypothetical protein
MENSEIHADEVANDTIQVLRRFRMARAGVDLLLSDGTVMSDEVRMRILEIREALSLPSQVVGTRVEN